MDMVDAAWSAGLFDGDGTVRLVNNSNGCSIRVLSTDEDIVDNFLIRTGSVGVKYGAYQDTRELKNGGMRKPHWEGVIMGTEICRQIWGEWEPYLSARRREQFIKVFDAIDNRPLITRKGEVNVRHR